MKKVLSKSFIIITCFTLFFIGCSEETPTEHQTIDELSGQWSGTIDIPKQSLQILIQLEKKDDWNGTISIPIQGISEYPLKKVKLENEEVLFTLDIQGKLITFEGQFADGQISGTFTQDGQSFPFTLMRVSEVETAGDFLSIETEQGTLYGELLLPDGEGPFPIMIIIPGSGPTDRNGNQPGMENNSLKLLAEDLADNGIASLRYDKRGADKNSLKNIKEEDIDFDRFVEDAAAWIRLLTKDKRFSKIGIIGHSQGSLEGMLASQKGNVDLFVSIAGAGRTMDEVLYDQLKVQLPDHLLEESKRIMEKVKKGEQIQKVSPDLQSLFRPSIQPFLSTIMQYRPTEEIAKLNIPTLIINGTNDLQVPKNEAKLLQQASENSELLIIEKMNHVLKEAPKDREENLATYFDADLPLAEGLMEGILTFLKGVEFIK